MATPQPLFYNNIDSIINEKLVNEDGRMNEVWVNFFSQLIQKVQASIGNAANEGLVPPALSTIAPTVPPSMMTIDQFAIVQAGAANGTLLYDSGTDTLKVKLASPVGMTTNYFHTITTN